MKIKVERCKQGAANFAGLMFVVELVKRSGLDKVVKKHPCKVGARISDLNVLLSYCCLLAQGKSDYEHVREFKDDKDFRDLTGIKIVPSAETLRQRLDEMAKDELFIEAVRGCSFRFWKQSEREASGEKIGDEEYVRVDGDTTAFDNSDTKKEGVESIKGSGIEGYNSIFAHFVVRKRCAELCNSRAGINVKFS